MNEHTRDGEDAADAVAPVEPASPPPRPESDEATPEASEAWLPLVGGAGLTIWLAILLVLGAGGLLAGEQEMAGLVAIAGLFATSHAADLDRRWGGLYRLIAWIVPASGLLVFLAFASVVYDSALVGPARIAALTTSAVGALVSLLTIVPSFSHRLCALLFRTSRSSHTLRLAARLVAIGLFLSVTGGIAAELILEPLLNDPEALFSRISPMGQTVGLMALALASVGYLVRRGLRETFVRLGLVPITRGQIAIAGIGVIALIGLNAGADVFQHTLFPGLWERDHRINAALAVGMNLPRAMSIGLMAGIGEEITLRGALQPKLGIVLTSLLFAILHVQYSWFGMAVIFAFGLLLGMIRTRANTSVVVVVHSAYDVIVLLTMA